MQKLCIMMEPCKEWYMLRNIIALMLAFFAYQPYQAPLLTDKNGQRRPASFADCQEAADELIAEFKNRKSR